MTNTDAIKLATDHDLPLSTADWNESGRAMNRSLRANLTDDSLIIKLGVKGGHVVWVSTQGDTIGFLPYGKDEVQEIPTVALSLAGW
jgi:hypothetical protein